MCMLISLRLHFLYIGCMKNPDALKGKARAYVRPLRENKAGEVAVRSNVRRVGERGQASKFKGLTEALDWLFHEDRHIVGYAIIFSDAELLRYVNDILPVDHRVSESSWLRYKKGEISRDELDADVERFRMAYERALMVQRGKLFELMAEDVPGGWQRWSWIIERRFDEWNLRNKVVEESVEPKQLVFRVERGGSG